MLLKVAILVLLIMIFAQDMKSRAVYWFLFPLLAICLLLYKVDEQGISNTLPSIIVNISFLAIQYVLVCAWFSVRNKKWTNITAGLLGWGDVLFLLSSAFGLSVFSLLSFYIASLTVVCLYWIVIKAHGKDNKYVPLAGLQALLLALVFLGDWWFFHIDLTGDNWVFEAIGQ
ncbi:hypothetical protein [Mucilaginibacter sp. HD30]